MQSATFVEYCARPWAPLGSGLAQHAAFVGKGVLPWAPGCLCTIVWAWVVVLSVAVLFVFFVVRTLVVVLLVAALFA